MNSKRCNWFMYHYFTNLSATLVRLYRVESWSTSKESTQICCHVLRTRKVHVSWQFAGLSITWYVRIYSARIESNRQVSQTNRLKFCCHILRTRKVIDSSLLSRFKNEKGSCIIFSRVLVSRGTYLLRANRVESLSTLDESTQVVVTF